MSTNIITHRGLEPSKKDFYVESAKQAFESHLSRGFGIEFDINFTKDNKIIIFHDSGLERITKGGNKSFFSEMNSAEISKLRLGNGDRLCFLGELLEIIARGAEQISALHLKGKFQEEKYLDILLSYLADNKKMLSKIFVFDVKVETAKYLKNKLLELKLAPSVAHPYDIKRYNEAVNGTLLDTEEAIANKDLFSWVWLDEWDSADENGKTKKFYTPETFEVLKKNGLKIALVTPELHGTSPGLLGGEVHPGAKKDRLFNLIEEIISLEPDALCTDYPEEIKKIIEEKKL